VLLRLTGFQVTINGWIWDVAITNALAKAKKSGVEVTAVRARAEIDPSRQVANWHLGPVDAALQERLDKKIGRTRLGGYSKNGARTAPLSSTNFVRPPLHCP